MKCFAIIGVCLVGLTLAGCYQWPSETQLYRIATDALRQQPGFPADAVIAPVTNATVSIGRSAAWFEIPYQYTDATGRKAAGSHTVTLRYMAHDWEVDRVYPTPVFTNAPPK